MTEQHDAPEGGAEWKMVPVEPTPEMLAMADDAMVATLDGESWLQHARNAWTAMLAAAPTSPEPSGLVDAVRPEAIQSALKFADDFLGLAMAYSSARIEVWEDGTFSDNEHADARRDLEIAKGEHRKLETEFLRWWAPRDGFDGPIRALDATLSGQQGEAAPETYWKGDITVAGPVDGMNEKHPEGSYFRLVAMQGEEKRHQILFSRGAAEDLRDELTGALDKVGRGQQGGAVPAGEVTAQELLDALNTKPGISFVATIKDVQDVLWELRRARLAEQPAPAGTGEADRVEGLRPGIEKALEIVEAEREIVSVSSSAYQRLWSVRDALRDVLDGASGQETTP